MNDDWTKSLTDEQKAQVWEFIVYTVKEIRSEIADDILATSDLWKMQGLNKSRRTQKAFEICAAIAWGKHELARHNLEGEYRMIHVLFLIPAFFMGYVACYVAMTYGVKQND